MFGWKWMGSRENFTYIFWNAIMTGLKRSGNLYLQQSILHRNFCHKSILNEKPVQFYSQQNISCWFSKWVIYKKKIYSENMPNFCWLGLFHFKKYLNFLRICSLLSENLPNFVFSSLKLHNQYCHTFHSP